MSPLMRSVTALACCCATICSAAPLLAQSAADSAAAQSLFEQARALLAQGKAAEACPKLEESQRLDPGTGTLLNLAQCYEKTGRLASAWNKYLEAAASARASGSTQREKLARKRAEALAPRLSKLTVQVAAGAQEIPGLAVTRDGQVIGAAQWGLPIAADEGEHVVVATAPGYVTWQTTVQVSGEAKTVAVSVPELVAQPPEPEATGPARAEPSAGASGPLADVGASEQTGLGTQRVLAVVAGGVGVVGLGVGTVFGLKSKSKHDTAEKYCDGSRCTDARGVEAGEDAYAAGNVATIAMLVGAAGVAGGLALWFTAPRASSAPGTELAVGLGSVRLRGTF